MNSKSVAALTSVIVFIAMIAVFIVYCLSLGVRPGKPKNRTELSIVAPDISNLVVGSNVLFRGVPIGHVTGIEASTKAATINFYVDGQYKVPVDSDIRFDNLSALGEAYIEVEPRSSGGPSYQNGQRIASESLKQPPSISELAASVTRVLNQLDPDQLSRIVGQADTALADPKSVLPNWSRTNLLLRNITLDFHGQGREVVDNAQVLLRNAGFVGPALAATIDPLRALGPSLGGPPMDDVWLFGYSLLPMDFLQFGGLLDRIQKFLDDRGPDLRVLGEATSENMNLIADALTNLDGNQLMSRLLATVPADGVIDLHVQVPKG
ncbi:MlaD family protein [Mycobacterium sp. E1747]|uniref:MlaD family protein n=1 Tax=Mycobacterium sp. E1747 TaxID=1834128 RepID=UPI0007FBFA4F|nr:MlaD family protein [Mycobacterium sp. E1747]OBH05885.1 mammalian cell entry protein [Mycobacterium sp. E1747]